MTIVAAIDYAPEQGEGSDGGEIEFRLDSSEGMAKTRDRKSGDLAYRSGKRGWNG